MKRLLVVLMAGALALAAQDKQEKQQTQQAPREWVQKIIEIKHADVDRISRLIQILGGSVRADPSLRVIAVNAPPQTMAAIEDAVKRLDVPPPPQKNIELTVFMLMASPRTDSAPELPELASAIKQLRAVFPYKSYHLMDSFVLRGPDGGDWVRTSGVLPAASGMTTTGYYSFQARLFAEPAGASALIRIDGLHLAVQGGGKVVGEIATGIDVREGQKVVVGKTNVSGGDDALILVVTAKVVE